MKLFDRAIEVLLTNLSLYDGDCGFGYRLFRIAGEDQARIFRLKRHSMKNELGAPPPTKGSFIALTVEPGTEKIIIAYCSFPETGESTRHAVLSYDLRELTKGKKQICDFLMRGKIPVADNEFA